MLLPKKRSDYKVGDSVVVDLPTRTIEGTIGYVGETDVRIDTSAQGYSWSNEVLNKQQFEDGLRQDEPELSDEELDKLPISVEVNGEWQTFPDAAAADEALNAEPVPEAAGNFHITDDHLGEGGKTEIRPEHCSHPHPVPVGAGASWSHRRGAAGSFAVCRMGRSAGCL